MGPPGVGKSTIAQQIAKDYKLHHIHIKDVITQAIENLTRAAKRAETEADKPRGADDRLDEEEEEDDDEEDLEDEEELPDLDELDAINDNMENNNGKNLSRY